MDSHAESIVVPLVGTTEKLKLTYGMEIEFVFAFHQSELERVLKTGGLGRKDVIQKNIPFNIRSIRPYTPYREPTENCYNSWGLTKHRLGGALPRPYGTEPMEIVSRVLAEKVPSFEQNVRGSMRMKDKTQDLYSSGALITVDHSVCGVGSERIPEWLPRVENANAEDWDSYGVELVTPVYTTRTGPVANEIRGLRQVFNAIRGTEKDQHGAFVTNQCGLHVHVQAPTDIKVLHELAMILLIYEDEISTLHPQSRRPWHPASKGKNASNRTGILLQVGDEAENLNCSMTALQENFTVGQLRNRIGLRGSTMVRLSKLFNGPVPEGEDYPNGDRNRLTNFTSAVRGRNEDGKEFPSTIEFRQAAGSLDEDDVGKWVDFCIGLVRLAYFYRDNPGSFPVTSWEDRVSVFDLIARMGLGAEAEDYWKRKQQYYSNDSPDREWQTDNEVRTEDDESSNTSSSDFSQEGNDYDAWTNLDDGCIVGKSLSEAFDEGLTLKEAEVYYQIHGVGN